MLSYFRLIYLYPELTNHTYSLHRPRCCRLWSYGLMHLNDAQSQRVHLRLYRTRSAQDATSMVHSSNTRVRCLRAGAAVCACTGSSSGGPASTSMRVVLPVPVLIDVRTPALVL